MIDWTDIYKQYAGLWVAIKGENTVVASGHTLKEALGKAKKKGFDNPLMNYIPQKISTFSGCL